MFIEGQPIIDKVLDRASADTSGLVTLLKLREVVMWLLGDTTFLPPIEHTNKTEDTKRLKKLEDEWGRAILRVVRPDLSSQQWTGLFGELVAKEIFVLLGNTVSKPRKIQTYRPDLEVDDSIIEVKTQTYYTTGTAGEKISGSAFKYAEVPALYQKPLKIVCIGGAEKLCKEKYGNLSGETLTEQKQTFLNFYREQRIEFVGATDLLSLI
jgi:hypothetical protein